MNDEQLMLFDISPYCPDTENKILTFEDMLTFAFNNGLKVKDEIHGTYRSLKVYKPNMQEWYGCFNLNESSDKAIIQSCSIDYNLGGSSFYCATKNEYVDEELFCIEGGRVGLKVIDNKRGRYKEDIFRYNGGNPKKESGWLVL